MYCCEREYRSKWKTREAVIGFTEDSVERLLEERTVELNISVGVGVCQMGEGEGVIGFTKDSVERLLEESRVQLNISVGVGVCQMGEGEEHSRKKQQPGQGHGDERAWLVPAAACPGQGVVIVLVAQSCLILCDFMDCSPPGSSVHGILLIGILEWGTISSSRKFF